MKHCQGHAETNTRQDWVFYPHLNGPRKDFYMGLLWPPLTSSLLLQLTLVALLTPLF